MPGVAAQTTPAQTVWVVNLYSTTKTKQCITINPATIITNEPPCWNALAGNAIVIIFNVHRYSVRIIDQCDVTIASGSHIDDITIAKLLTFEILSRAARNEGMIFVYLRLREDSITNMQWYFAMMNITRGWIDVRDDIFCMFRNRKNLRTLNRLVSDVIINWHAQRARREMSFIPSALPKVLLVMACRWIIGILKIIKNDAMEPEEITNIEIYRLKFLLKQHVFVCTWPASMPEVCRLRTVQLVLELCTVLALT